MSEAIRLSTLQAADPLAARVHATWTAGDFGRIAVGYERSAAELITRLGLAAGERLLDVACGSGNLALPAARAGAVVTAIDIAPNLVAQTRRHALAEGLPILADVGDAEEMPYADGAFDTVVSMFGVMFAARPARATAQLARVCRPGGRIVLANWTPEGFIGRMFAITREHVPPPSDVPSPLLWGMEDPMRERLAPYARDLQLVRRQITFEYPMPPARVADLFREWYGPMVRAFGSLGSGAQARFREALVEHWSEHDRAQDGTTRVNSEYLEVIVEVQ